MPRKTLEERQAHVEKANSAQGLLQKFQHFWPHIDDLSILVTGQTETGKDDYIELALILHVHSTGAHAHPLHGSLYNKRTRNRLTFVQVGNSVPTGSCTTFLVAQYTGHDPPTIPP